MTDTVRACRPDDVPDIARLFSSVFLKKQQPPAASLVGYVEDFLFGAPPQDADISSRVFVDGDERVQGFIGVIPHRMMLSGRPLRAAAAGSLMVDHPERHPTAGARLLRSFLSGPQDLSFSETANAISQRMWERAGGERMATASMDWIRVLRPAGFALSMATRVVPAAALLKPVSKVADRIIDRAWSAPFAPPPLDLAHSDDDVGDDELMSLLPALSETYALHPDWSPLRLRFLLAHAEQKERHGKLYRRVVRDRTGKACGCYLYYGRPGAVAWTLQVLARPDATGATIDSLLRHAAGLGCVAIRGRTQFDLLDSLLVRDCIFVHRSATMLHARDKELLAGVRPGGVLSGLAGEGWARLIGGEFA